MPESNHLLSSFNLLYIYGNCPSKHKRKDPEQFFMQISTRILFGGMGNFMPRSKSWAILHRPLHFFRSHTLKFSSHFLHSMFSIPLVIIISSCANFLYQCILMNRISSNGRFLILMPFSLLLHR